METKAEYNVDGGQVAPPVPWRLIVRCPCCAEAIMITRADGKVMVKVVELAQPRKLDGRGRLPTSQRPQETSEVWEVT